MRQKYDLLVSAKKTIQQFMERPTHARDGSNNANERILRAKVHGHSRLDLSGLGLASLPFELFNLTALTHLDLSGNQLGLLPGSFQKLRSLKQLNLSFNKLDDINIGWDKLARLKMLHLDHNDLTELPNEIWRMPQLRGLTANHNKLRAIRISTPMENLATFMLRGNYLGTMPTSLSNMKNLEKLDLSGNELTEIGSEIGELTKLRILDISNNQLSCIAKEIAHLHSLESIYVRNNPIKELPAELGTVETLREIELPEGMSVPPSDIVAQGTPSVLAYLRSLTDNEFAVYPFQAKLILVGQGNAGKTHLLSNLIDGNDSGSHKGKTEGVEVRDFLVQHPSIPGTKMRLRAWDFGGQEIQHATHQFFLTDKSLFLLLWNARQEVGKRGGNLHYWLEMIKSRAPESPVIVVGTHCDQEPARVSLEFLRKQFPQIVDVCEISNTTKYGIDSLQEKIQLVAASLPVMDEKWNQRWYKARDAIVSMTEPHVNQEVVLSAMRRNKVRPEEEALVGTRLHLLGDIVYFKDDPLLKHTVVLDPEWLTKHVCRAISSEKVLANSGILTDEMLEEIWSDEPQHVRKELLTFMERYDLCYQLDSDRTQSIIPQALPDSPPENLQVEWDSLKDKRKLSIRYVFRGSLPPGVPSWFIAREHRFSLGLHWRYGVLLEHKNGSRALLELTENIGDVNVLLSVRGEEPYTFFNLLQDGFEETLSRYPGLDVTRRVPCNGHRCTEEDCAYEFELPVLTRYMKRGRDRIICQQSLVDFEVVDLLYAITLPKAETVGQIGALLAKTNQIASSVGKIEGQLSSVDAVTSSLSRIEDRLSDVMAHEQRSFTKLFTALQSSVDTACPSVFVIDPDGQAWTKKLLGQPLKLRLCCEMPGCWHPLESVGVYEVKDPAKWLVKVAPAFKALCKVLVSGAPVAAAAVGYVSPELGLMFAANIKLASELTKLVPEIAEEDQLRIEAVDEPSRAVDAAFQELRKVIIGQDPDLLRTGLQKVLMPEGNYLWLCDDHAKASK
jgi:GTPase SAR1 family protein